MRALELAARLDFMRHQDRLLRSLAHQDLHYRAFVVRQMERLVIHHDSEDVLQTVRSSCHEAVGPMALHFLCAYNDLYPRHLRATYSPVASPVHSQLVSSAGRAGARVRPEGLDAIGRAATQLLEPCIRALRKRAAGASGRERRVLMTALARFHHSEVETFLMDRLGDESEGPLAAFLLTACFGLYSDEKLLPRISQVWGRETLPQFLLALRYIPTDGAFEMLARAARHGSPAVQWVTAACLDRFGGHDFGRVTEAIFEGQLGWAVAHALESVGRIGRIDPGLALVEKALASYRHPIVRTAGLHALAGLQCERSLELCLEEVRSPASPHSLAQAVSTLIRLGAPPEQRAKLFEPLLRSPSREVVTQAILGLVGADDFVAGRAIRGLIVDGDEEERTQAAYCLGYFPGDSSLRVLEHLIRTDPSPSVRLQALRAAGYYERTPTVTHRLISFLELEDEQLVVDALRLLGAQSDVAEVDKVVEALATVGRYGAAPGVRRVAHRALCRFDTKLARGTVQQTLAEKSGDPDALLGAVEGTGWSQVNPNDLDVLRPLLRHRLAPVRSAAAKVLFTWGSFEGLETLEEQLEGTGAEAREAVRSLEEIATVLDYLMGEPRFFTLSEKLRGRLKSPEYLEFSRRELGLVAAPADPGEAVDPDAPVLSATTWQTGELGGSTGSQVLADIEAARRKYPRLKTGRKPREPAAEIPPVLGPEDRLSPESSRKPWAVGATGVAVGAILFGALVLGRGGRDEPATPAEGGAESAEVAGQSMKVGSVRGVVKLETKPGSAAEIIGPEAVVDPGARLLAEEGAAVRLGLQPAGNALTLFGVGSLLFGGLQMEDPSRRIVRVDVSDLEGRVAFDLKWGRPRVELVLGGFRVRAWKGLYALEWGANGGAVRVASGRVEVTDPREQFTLVTEGQQYLFARGAEKGEVSAFDPSSTPWR